MSDPFDDAALELNRRIARFHRRSVAVTAVSAVAGASATAVASFDAFMARLPPRLAGIAVGSVFIGAGVAVAVIVGNATRAALAGRRGRWITEVAASWKVDRGELEAFALPLGPGTDRAASQRALRLGVRLAGAFALVIAIVAVVAGTDTALMVGGAGAVVLFFASFNRYLGWRPPR